LAVGVLQEVAERFLTELVFGREVGIDSFSPVVLSWPGVPTGDDWQHGIRGQRE